MEKAWRGIARAMLAPLMFILLTITTPAAQARDIIMCTVPWAPFYGPELERNGFITALATAALEAAGHDPEVQFMPWARAMLEVKQGDRQVLLGAYYTEERARTYVASDELYATEVGLIALRDLGVQRFEGLRELTPYRIGYGRGWATTEEFDRATFLNKEAADNNVLNVRKLYAGRIDMIAMNFDRFRQIAGDEGYDPDRAVFLEPALKSSGLYLMFSRAMENPEKITREFNAGLERIRENGEYDRILESFGLNS